VALCGCVAGSLCDPDSCPGSARTVSDLNRDAVLCDLLGHPRSDPDCDRNRDRNGNSDRFAVADFDWSGRGFGD